MATLLDDDGAPGDRTAGWKGCDSAGRAVASGPYFIRLRTGYTTDVRKVMLVR